MKPAGATGIDSDATRTRTYSADRTTIVDQVPRAISLLPEVSRTTTPPKKTNSEEKIDFYLVAETSPLTGIGSHAELQSTTFGRSHANCTIALAYYMNERNVGTLSISVKTASSRYRHLKSLVGVQGSGWKETSVVVGEHVGFQIVVQATAGYGSQMSGGDIAIDDIRFSDCVPGARDSR